jgi:transposase
VGGATWAFQNHPDRQPAMYTRRHGVRHLLAAYDLKSDQLSGQIKRRKRHQEFLAFLKSLRRKYPKEERLYIILDNFSPHGHQKVQDWGKKNNIKFVFTPTNASWLNRIECHFGALRKFVLQNSNYESHDELGTAIQKYLRWRNKHAKDQQLLKVQKRYDFS